ncbi:MAG: murein L,D-transpeptidase [Pseudomonadales bacterium]
MFTPSLRYALKVTLLLLLSASTCASTAAIPALVSEGLAPEHTIINSDEEIWTASNGLTPNGQELLQAIKNLDLYGLSPNAFRKDLNQLTGAASGNEELEHQFNRVFERLSQALSQGQTSPTEQSEWSIKQEAVSTDKLFSLLRNKAKLSEILANLRPTSQQHQQLLSALQHYVSIQSNGGWRSLSNSDLVLNPGDRHPDIARLRDRLRIEGDYQGQMQADPLYFGPSLSLALQQFQSRHGLINDGMLDLQTRRTLRVPLAKRIEQLRVNLERWRWLPRELGERYLLVNTAGGYADLIENNARKLTVRTIAGRPYRATPSLSSKITRLVVNPSWGVPHRIAVEDLLPMQQNNNQFFTNKAIRVFSSKGTELDTSTINWSAVSARNFPYRLRQDPGTDNSMGRIKFVFANEFDVYLHDTPNKILFELPSRSFSSGCVRVEEPLLLAKSLIAEDSNALSVLEDSSRSNNADTTNVGLINPVPIYLVYMTAWVDEKGLLHFTTDRYGRDPLIAQELQDNSQRTAALP